MDQLERIRARVEQLEEDVRDLKLLLADFNADIRKDVHATMTPIGIDLNDFRKEIRGLVTTLQSVAQSVALLQQWSGQQDEKLTTMQAEIRRPWWRRGKP